MKDFKRYRLVTKVGDQSKVISSYADLDIAQFVWDQEAGGYAARGFSLQILDRFWDITPSPIKGSNSHQLVSEDYRRAA